MGKRQQAGQNKEPDALVIPRESFMAKLTERLNAGRSILETRVSNLNELEENKRQYYKWDSYNSEFLKSAFNNEDSEYRTRYDNVNRAFLITTPSNASEELKELKEDIQNKIDFLDRLLETAELLKSLVDIAPVLPAQESGIKKDATVPDSVFIVHGHNTSVLHEVARTIEKLKLRPIILHEQANEGKTLIEKFETHSAVRFAIVLLTDDDEGKAKTELNVKKRARQNVVLELGYFFAKLGRKNVVSLHSEGVELPSDIHGIVYTPLDAAGNWKFGVVRELKAAGFKVSADSLL
jgi:hypothetical protein